MVIYGRPPFLERRSFHGFSEIVPVIVLALCVTALGLFGTGELASAALNILWLVALRRS